jgi:hypothetical protein
VLIACTVAAGAAVVLVALSRVGSFSLGTLTFFAAAALLTELLVIPQDEASLDPRDTTAFSFSGSIHIATVLVLGPLAGSLVAAWGVLSADGVRAKPWKQILFNASAYAIAALVGGYAYVGAGGEPGRFDLPTALPAIALLALVVYGVGALFVAAVIALDTDVGVGTTAAEALRTGGVAAIGEAGVGVALAYFMLAEPWGVIALLPLMFAVYRSQERLVTLRRETANALETFANVVDERDPYTFHHSDRVAQYVRDLADALGFPPAEVARIRWAGRLHDLGKITVDAAVLRKAGKLDEEEWEVMRRHPRLSSRLLRRFHLAVDHANAVEYHHERADGRGYYSIAPENVPLTAHFLIVADSFDAMTSDRPYRNGLPVEVALEEIERNAGTQFHPAVAKAFVALQRGQDVPAVLSIEEGAELRRMLRDETRRSIEWDLMPGFDMIAAGAVILALLAAGTGLGSLAAPLLALGVVSIVLSRLERLRGRRLAVRLRRLLESGEERSVIFSNLASALALSSDLRWAGLVRWDEASITGKIEAQWSSSGGAPAETALTSWLLRDSERASRPLTAAGKELGQEGEYVAVPLRRDGQLAGYLVAGVVPRVPRPLAHALAECGAELSARFAPSDEEPVTELHVVAAG